MRKLDSPSEEPHPAAHPRMSWRIPVALLAAGVVGAATFLGFHEFRGRRQDFPRTTAQLQKSTISAPPPAAINDPDALKRAQDEAASLQSRLSATDDRLKESTAVLAEEQHRLTAEQAQSKEIAVERDTLRDQLNAARSEAEILRKTTTTSDADKSQQTMRIAELETKIRDLNGALEDKSTALNDKDRMLALDAEFLAHDRDIRDLIGARNLYISDIVDMTEDGKTAKQFGRIFYTKDRSLVFYGFDLDKQAGLRRDASFQAWGRGSHQDSPVSLGLFYQDDGHKRWVLRCSDAKTLARLDMVFVTMEPPGGSSKPTGKPLLRAYLQIEPNHR